MAEFGSGFDFTGTSSPAPVTAAGEAGAAGGGGAAPMSAPPQPSMFGSGIYQPAQQGADPLDIAAGQLEQRINAAQRATTGPGGAILGLFNPEARTHNLALIPAATEQLQKIREQKATIQANQQQAATLGLAPGEVPDQATQEQRVTFAKNRALQGNLKVYQGLAAVDPKAAESIADQVYEATGAHLKNAQFAYDKLSMMSTAGEYNSALKELRENGTLSGIEALGFKVPDGPQGFAQFNANKAREGAALRDAQVHLSSIRQKLEDRNTYQPMEKKEAETYGGRLTTAYGDQIGNGTWSRNGASGTRGMIVNGMSDPRDLGKNFTLGTNDQRKEIGEAFSAAVPKADLEKYRAFNRTYDLATKDAKGNPVAAGDINTNPNVQQGIAEGLASMLRGGSGGANVGLLKIELMKRGWTQQAADSFTSNYNGIWNTIEGKQVEPYLTQLTRGQVRDVLDTLHDYNGKAMADRVGRIAERAGALGFDSSVFGLGRGESAAGLDSAMEQGRQNEIQRITPQHQAIGGGDGVLQLGAQLPGATATGLPPGAQPTNQLPSRFPLRTPVQQATQPQPAAPPPAGPQSPGTPAPPAPAAAPGGAGGGASPPPAPNQPGGAAPVAAPSPNGSGPAGGGGPPDPVAHAMNGVSAAVHQFAADNGGTPEHADAQVKKLATNPRIEKEIEATGQVSGPTVAKALGAGGNKTLVTHLTDFLNKWFGTAYAAQAQAQTQEGEAQKIAGQRIGAFATEHAPVIGSTVGAIGGSVAGPAGAVAGGAAGGAGGQSLKDYILGHPQDPAKIAEEGALGGVFGVAGPAGRPLVGAGLRALGAGGVEAGAEAGRGGSAKETFEAGAKGAASAIGGEAFGRALGMVGHKIFSMFGESSQKAVYNASKEYADAKHILDTEPNRLPSVGGAAGGPNPKYLAAETAAGKAETVLKDAGLDPAEAAYAYKVTADKVPTAEAQVNKPGAVEKENIGGGYQQIEKEVASHGVGAPRANGKLPDGPMAAVENGAVSQKHAELAQRTEMAITAPAANWQEKWGHLQDARSALLTAEREARTSTTPGRTLEGDDMRRLADTVRVQQEKAAKYVFGEQKGKEVITRLKALDTRYRNLMTATNNGDMMAAAKMRGEDGRKADKAFRAFAAGDPSAIAAWDALRKPGRDVEKGVHDLVGMERIPYVGAVFSAAKMLARLGEWRADRAAGSTVKFADIMRRERDTTGQTARDIAGGIGARGATMGGPSNGTPSPPQAPGREPYTGVTYHGRNIDGPILP